MIYAISIFLLLLTLFFQSAGFIYFGIFVALISVPLLFIAGRPDRKIQRTTANISMTIFVIVSGISIFFSILPIRSIPALIWSVAYFGIFLYYQCLTKTGKQLENLSKIFVILTSLFGLYSIYNFISVGLTSYTRLDGVIGNHNVYGGFLIIPFLLSLYLIIKEEEKSKAQKWQKIGWYISGTIILSSIILTFSRGTWVSILVAVVISVIIFWKKRSSRTSVCTGRTCAKFFILAILAMLSTGSIWLLARNSTATQNPSGLASTAVFAQQDAESNAFTARIHYFEDAWHTFLQRPLTGFGSGLYADAARIYKTDPNYGSFADPHNWLLKMLVENGLIVTIIFVIFIISLFWQMVRLIKKRKEMSWLAVAIFTGLVGSAFHGLMDFDWSVNNLMIVFFIFAGSLYGYLLNTDEAEKMRYFPKWSHYVLLGLILVASIISVQLLRADFARARGDVYYMQAGDADTALNSYYESEIINKYEPMTFYDLWRVYYNLKRYPVAERAIQKAIELMPENGVYYGALARTELAMGDLVNYPVSLRNSIRYFPASDLGYHVMLVEYDFVTKDYAEATSTIDSVLSIYEKYQSTLWYRSDPNSEAIDANIIRLKELEKKIADIGDKR